MEEVMKPGMSGAHGMMCKCPHHKVMPLMIVLLALIFLLKALGVLTAGVVDIVWPILLGIGGLTKLFGGGCKCC